MTEDLRIGLIGAGRIGAIHGANLAHRIQGARLVSVADVHEESAKAFAETHGLTGWHTDPLSVLTDPTVDAVAICSATDTHANLMEAAAAQGKHIFCEKPIDLDLDRVDSALAKVSASGVTLQVGFNRRFDPSFAQARASIQEGRIGTPQLLQITSFDPAPPPLAYVRVSGGLFLDMAIHDFDMARFLVGSDITEVYAAGAVLVNPEIGEAGDIDTAVTTLRFANGALGTIQNCRQAAHGYDQRAQVLGTEGFVSVDNHLPHQATLGNRDGIHGALPEAFFLERYASAYLAQMEAFVGAVRDGGPSPVSGQDARAPVLAALAASRSVAEGRPVSISEVTPAR